MHSPLPNNNSIPINLQQIKCNSKSLHYNPWKIKAIILLLSTPEGTVLEGEDNNIFNTQHPISDIKEKHT